MKTNHLIRFFVFALLIGITACDSNKAAAQKGDNWLLYYTHESIVPQKPNWKNADFKHMSYFARYRASADAFQRYGGDPLGPIVAIWQVKRYLGEKPKEIKCGKEPKYPKKPSNMTRSSPEFKKLRELWGRAYEDHQSCRHKNSNIIEKSTTNKHYYARSLNNYAIIAQPRPENHASYEVNVSYGPLTDVLEKGLSPENFAIKDQLYYDDYRNLGKKRYRLPGEDANLYYNIRSLLRKPSSAKKASSPYQRPVFIKDTPVKWEEIKGITISAAQYDYLEKRCQKIFECYLDENAPELNTAQKAYIKATAWDIDTDFYEQDQLIEKANDFRF